MTIIPIAIKSYLDLAMWGTVGVGLSLIQQMWSGFWFAAGALLAARWAVVLGLIGGVLMSGSLSAQTLQQPDPRLTGQLPGCRWTTFLGEGLVGPDHLPYVVLLNPFGPQKAEVTLFDNAGHSPTFIHEVPQGRSEQTWLNTRRPWMSKMTAFSVTIRWEIGGEAHLTSWRVPVWSPGQSASEWIRGWRVELVSPSWYIPVCE